MAFDTERIELDDIEVDMLDRGEEVKTETSSGQEVKITLEHESVRRK